MFRHFVLVLLDPCHICGLHVQLSTALPSIVPKLSETLADPHLKVQAAARQALTEVSRPAQSSYDNPDAGVQSYLFLKMQVREHRHIPAHFEV